MASSFQSRNKFDRLLLTSAVAATRFVFRSHYLYDIDSVNFALGIRRFDPRVYQPHPPGYFLYISLGRLLNAVLHDANLSLVVLSIVASCGVVLIVYQMTLEWFGLSAARFAAVLFLLSPLVWFHGTVALAYIIEAFFSALLGYLCWRNDGDHWVPVMSSGLILGISAGIRPSSLLLLGPLFLFSLRDATPSRRVASLGVLFLTLTAWSVPMISASGGVGVYCSSLISLWRLVPSKATVFNSTPANSIARAFTIAIIYVLAFGAASLAPFGAMAQGVSVDARKKRFTAVWIAPALCFFTFIFLKFVNSGYVLILTAPSCIWLGFWASEWYRNAPCRRPFKLAVIAACALTNICIFLLSPLYCSYRSVRRFEAELQELQKALPQIASERDSLIIGFDSHFLGYRHAGYYFPGYLTLEYPEVKLLEGTRIFAMQGRDTRLLDGLPLTSCSHFVLFPLPGSEREYVEYLENFRAKFPRQALQTVRAGDHNFVTGPISELPLLFPRSAAQSVTALRHHEVRSVNRSVHRPKGRDTKSMNPQQFATSSDLGSKLQFH